MTGSVTLAPGRRTQTAFKAIGAQHEPSSPPSCRSPGMSLPLYQGSSTPLPWAGVLVHTRPFAAPLGATIDMMSMTSSTHGLNFSRHGGCMWRGTIVNSQDSAKPHGPSTTTTSVRRFAALHSWRPSHMAAMWSRPSKIHLGGSRTERGQNQLNHSRRNISHSSLFCEPFLLPFCEPL